MRIEAHMIAWAVALAMTPLSTAQNILFVNHLAEPGGDGQAWSSAYRDLFEALDDAATDRPAHGQGSAGRAADTGGRVE